MATAEERLRECYGFAFPDDFFRFRDFLASLPPGILYSSCDIFESHPFAVAAGRPAINHPDHPLWQDRYYDDLPEFITVFTGSSDGLHWGYFFDSPGELPPVVAHYWHRDSFEHVIDGDNLFEAVRSQVETSERDYTEMAQLPEETERCREILEQVAIVRESLNRFWTADRPETGNIYLEAYRGSRWRTPTIRTRSGMGIFPTERYRPLSARVFPHRGEVEALTAEAMQRLSEGFPGTALQLGHDLWPGAREFPECYLLLDAAYTALGREPLRLLSNEARAFRSWCDERRARK